MHYKSKSSMSVLALALLITSSMAAEEMNKESISLAFNNTLGTYMVNQAGFTLYYFLEDYPGNGTSSCYGICSDIWPPFYAENLTVARGLKAGDFTVANRSDGIKQIAYKGWPLYLYSQDINPNDINGQNIDERWFVINPVSSSFRKPTPTILKLKPDSLSLKEEKQDCTSCSGASLKGTY